MRPAIATVAGHEWESNLARHARSTGMARVVGRCTDPGSIRALAPRVDAVFIGSEVPWLGEVDVSSIGRHTHVVGIACDRPGGRLLASLGVDDVVDSRTSPAGLLAIATLHSPTSERHIIEVTGPRGAPGRSEVALALAHAIAAWHPTALLELDADAPSLGIRCGLGPDSHLVGPADGPSLFPAPVAGRRPSPLVNGMVESVASLHTTTILDGGPESTFSATFDVDEVVLVGEATPVGLVRLAALCARWDGQMPVLVVNRFRLDQDLAPVRAATGLEPAAVIPVLPPRSGPRPDPAMVHLLARVPRSGEAQRAAL